MALSRGTYCRMAAQDPRGDDGLLLTHPIIPGPFYDRPRLEVVVVTLSLPLPSITRARQRSVKWIAISRCSTLAIAENTLDDEYSRGRTSQTCRQEKDQNNKFEHSQDVGLVLGGAMR